LHNRMVVEFVVVWEHICRFRGFRSLFALINRSFVACGGTNDIVDSTPRARVRRNGCRVSGGAARWDAVPMTRVLAVPPAVLETRPGELPAQVTAPPRGPARVPPGPGSGVVLASSRVADTVDPLAFGGGLYCDKSGSWHTSWVVRHSRKRPLLM
jgi:hypothetical protein